MHALYPSLRIQGEEADESINKYEATVKPSDIPLDFISQDFLNGTHEKRFELLQKLQILYPGQLNSDFLFDRFSTRDAVVWIDPLDGTSEFVKGNLPAVTVLIGLTICGISKIGVIHSPFLEDSAVYGRTLFGTMEHGAFKLFYDGDAPKKEMLSRSPEYIDPFEKSSKLVENHVF